MLQAVGTPRSLAEAHAMLAAGQGVRIIAGGTAVMPALNYGTDDFTTLVSLRHAGLSGISIAGGRAEIGAAVTLSELEDEAALAFLRPALLAIASPTIRNMATVGGNLLVNQPYGDFAACLVALGASVSVSDGASSRPVPIDDLLKAGVKANEIVTAVSFAIPPDGAFRFVKAGRKALNAAAIVTVAALVTTKGGAVSQSRIALGGVAPRVVRASSVETALAGKPLDRPNVEKAAARASADIDPFDDAYASAWYRARVTPVHIRRALLGE
jgi:CO/xanthine dehydrogenase FAD-binding subunit